MSELGQHGESDTVMENSAVSMKRESNMKHRWCQTANNTVCYYQTPCNIAVILEQVSNCNVLLRKKMSMEKVTWKEQKNVINEVKSDESKSCTTAKECRYSVCEVNNKDNERKETERENVWTQPKKCMSKKHMHETH